MASSPKLGVLKKGNHNYNIIQKGSSKKGTSKTSTISPLRRGGSSSGSGKSVGGSKGQAGGGSTKRSGGSISGGKNGGY